MKELLEAALADLDAADASIEAARTKINEALALEQVEPPVEPSVEPPIEPETPEPEPEPNPPVAAGKWPCGEPHMGPIRQAKGKILLCNNIGDPSVTPFRQRIPKLFVGSCYTVGAHMGGRDGGMDHSPAGIARHAKATFQSFLSRRGGQNGTRNIWFDVEADLPSVNVPASVGYSVTESKSKYGRPGYANTYDIDVEKAWRDEAVRFFRLMSEAIIAEAKKAGFVGFEIGSYNHPAETSFSNYQSAGRYATQAAELNKPLLCPVMAYGGGNCYLASGKSQAGLSTAELVNRAIQKCKVQCENYRKVIPRPQKLIPAIFNCWVGAAVNDDHVVPAGSLGRLASTILDAGADGIYIYENTDPNNRLPRAQERYDEVVDVILRRGDFVNPYD